jgi:phosphoribosylanthranilate isomerase
VDAGAYRACVHVPFRRACHHPTVTRVKTCGITRPGDARLAVELGAWALGLIFWPRSPRACPIEVAEEIGAEQRRRVELAGVFVNATLEHVAATAERASLSLLQLHGDEGPAYCREAARRTGCKVMKAVRVKDPSQVTAIEAFHVDYHLLDAYVPGTPGGTGERFNWDLARRHRGSAPVVLSGGLTPDNVGEAIAAARPFAVDTASGTEAQPGRKDPARLEAFFRAVRAADALALA